MSPVLIDVFCWCIARSRAAEQIPEPGRRPLLASLLDRHIMGPALDLEGLWQDLRLQPGVTERAVASAFARMEELAPLLPVELRPVELLQVLSVTQRQALLAECPLEQEEVVAWLAAAQDPGPAAASGVPAEGPLGVVDAGAPPDAGTPDAAGQAAGASEADDPSARDQRVREARVLLKQAEVDQQAALQGEQRRGPRRPSSPSLPQAPAREQPPGRRRLIIAGVAALLVCSAGSLYWVLSDTVQHVPLAQVTVLQLETGTQLDDTLQATVLDPRWATMTPKQRQETAGEAFRQLRRKSVKTLYLLGPDRTTQAQVTTTPTGELTVTLPVPPPR